MPAFRALGATGQAPTTTYFGFVPDRLALLAPLHNDIVFGIQVDSISGALFVNQWTIYNTVFDAGANTPSLTLGAFTTAPDGTTNVAQRLVETTTNSKHALSAGYTGGTADTGTGPVPTTFRLAAFAKAGERTRCALSLGILHGGGSSPEAITVFDLAGGQIGVAGTIIGGGTHANWSITSSTITPYGNGWYLCQMDIIPGDCTINRDTTCQFYIDAGTGTGAMNISYVGDASKGLFVWKSTLLPPAAWGLTTQTFFDDFTSTATIDMADTRAPGFNWYIHNIWPYSSGFRGSPHDQATPSDSSQISITGGTVLNFGTTIVPNGEFFCMASAATDGATGFVSSNKYAGGWTIPALFECNFGWNSHTVGTAHTSWWIRCLDFLISPFTMPAIYDLTNPNSVGSAGRRNYELDMNFVEYGVLGKPSPDNTPVLSVEINHKNSASVGMRAWDAITDFSASKNTCTSGGQVYTSITSPNINNPPASSPAAWTATADNTLKSAGWFNSAAIGSIDFKQNNLYACLWLPATPKEPGHIINFCNGGPCNATYGMSSANAHMIYARNFTSGISTTLNALEVGDANTMTMLFQAGAVTYTVDYVRVTQ